MFQLTFENQDYTLIYSNCPQAYNKFISQDSSSISYINVETNKTYTVNKSLIYVIDYQSVFSDLDINDQNQFHAFIGL